MRNSPSAPIALSPAHGEGKEENVRKGGKRGEKKSILERRKEENVKKEGRECKKGRKR